jgi:hypothetical protein
MSRALTRTFIVAIVALALGLAAVAPASAGPAQVRRAVPGATASWVANAWAVLQGFLTGAPTRPVSTAKAGTTYTKPSGDYLMLPQTGGCIDPMGRPVPCSQ